MKILINDFSSLDKHYRANLINSVIGVKQASLIGTVGSNCISNLALFSSSVHLGSNPPLVAIFSRPEGDAPKQTLNNITVNNCLFSYPSCSKRMLGVTSHPLTTELSNGQSNGNNNQPANFKFFFVNRKLFRLA